MSIMDGASMAGGAGDSGGIGGSVSDAGGTKGAPGFRAAGLMRLARNPGAWAILGMVIACRLVGYLLTVRFPIGDMPPFQELSLFNNVSFASFAFVPIFGFVVMRAVRFLQADFVVARSVSRRQHALRCAIILAKRSFALVLVLTVTFLPIVLAVLGPSSQVLLYFAETFALQVLFFEVVALLYLCVQMLVRSAALSYALMLLYGLWDFMAGTIVGGGLPAIGWCVTLVADPLDATAFGAGVVVLAVQVAFLFVVLLVAATRVDLLERRSA